jgi:hypothetical protein
MYTGAFLRHVVADDGWICIDTHQGFFKHEFFNDYDEAASYILKADQAGKTVYFALATFKTATTRKQDNVALLKSFWGDCDVGPGKPYATRLEALTALDAFLAKTSLPAPSIVYSGRYGLHLYWTLQQPLTPDVWRPRAERLRELCKYHGFHLDHSRTVDHASVLRPVGTHNRKVGDNDFVVMSQLEPALEELPFDVPAMIERPRLLDGASVYREAIPSDAQIIANECAQIGELRDRQGDVPYSHWLYALWTLHFTTQSDELAHAWSRNHPNYTAAETQRKLDEATAPIKCSTFATCNDLCNGCAHRGEISTPLQLGRRSNGAANHTTDNNSIYAANSTGLWLRSEKTVKGKVVADNTLISKWPITLNSICRGERDGDFSLIFTMTTPHLGELSIPIPAGIFFSSHGMPEMHRLGAVIHHHEAMRDYVRKQMDQYHTDNAPQVRYSQFGWKDADNSFLFGNKLYTQNKTLAVVGAPEIERRARMLGPRAGSLAAWSAAANTLFATGCEPQSFALCCAFGAVLMRFLSEEEGGAIVNLVSEVSATGKTTALEAIASVWGELDGLRLLDEDTQISRGVMLGTLGNLPCVFDELHKRDPDSIRTFCTMFTSGRDKLRAKADGSIRDPAGDWQTILILGSNISLTDIMHTKNPEEAQAFRILELIAEQTFTGNEGDKLRRTLKENRGWAGDAFVRYLMQPGVLQAVRADLDNIVNELWSEFYGFDRRHRFWVRALACALCAGRIVTHIGILDFNSSRIIEWVINTLQDRNRSDIKQTSAQILNEALYELWAHTLVVDDAWSPRNRCLVLCAPSQNKSFVARRERNNGRMYVIRTWLRKWLTLHNISRTSFINELKTKKVILNDRKFVTLGAGTDYSMGGQILCFEINMHHPLMIEALEAAEVNVPEDEKAKAPVSNLINFPSAASPSPPLASEEF